MSKRKRLLPGIYSRDFQERSYAERQAVNSVIQGTGADLMKLSMIHITEMMKSRGLCKTGGLVLTIHDELLFEVPTNEVNQMIPLIKEAMEGVVHLKLPLKVSVKIGKKWGSLQPFEMKLTKK